jgi:hypothetical protein
MQQGKERRIKKYEKIRRAKIVPDVPGEDNRRIRRKFMLEEDERGNFCEAVVVHDQKPMRGADADNRQTLS